MTNKDSIFNVKNRSSSIVVYTLPEDGIRREFAPGETKRLKFDELEKLSYQSGGRTLINDYLMISNAEVTQELNIRTEPEYYLTEEQIIDLIKTGSQDAFLDCLDFAPDGVIDLVKDLSVKVPLTDYTKRRALKEKTGFDVDAALRHIEEEKAEANASDNTAKSTTPTRRVEVAGTEAPGRRTTPQYKIVSTETK